MAKAGTTPSWNRFAHWQRLPARLALAVLLVLLALSAVTPIVSSEGVHTAMIAEKPAGATGAKRERDVDLQLYDHVISRLRQGQGYYEAVAIEHRASRYPLRPGFAVRLPTLAMIEAHLPPPADPMRGGRVEGLLASLLLVGAVVAWWQRLKDEPGGLTVRPYAAFALCIGAQVWTIGYFFVLHELWSGALLVLAMGLHRPDKGKWLGAWLAAAAALAIREHAFPFVLLMAVVALWHRRWREGAAWLALSVLFVVLLAWHLHIVASLLRPDDPAGASWLTLRGLSGWMSMIVLASNLRFLPTALAGPLVVLMIFGWAGWRSALGSFATLLFLGYGLAFMIAGRPDNWYWGMMVAPAMFVGLAFVPMAAKGLFDAAFPRAKLATVNALEQG